MKTVQEEKVEINLTPLLKKTGLLIADKNIELELIESYKHKYNEDSQIVHKFTHKVLYALYGDTRKYTAKDIYTFIPRNKYNSVVIGFIKSLEILILNKIKPYPLDVVFVKYIEKTDTSIKAEFKITYLKEGD